MYLAGFLLLSALVFGSIAVTEALFFQMNGRFLWRAFIPAFIRFTIFPEDKIELDCYDILTEYASVMLLGSGLMLPIIAMNYMGLVHFW